MRTEKKWHVVYTKPGSEQKLAKSLSKKSIESYCPLNKSLHQWGERKKMIYKPLFNSYVFIQIDESQRAAVKQTDGVLNFVYWLDKPAVIRQEEIDAIKYFVQENTDVKLEKLRVSLAERVRITEAPMIYKEGTVIDLKSQTIKMTVPSLGIAMVAEMRKSQVEIIQNYQELTSKIA